MVKDPLVASIFLRLTSGKVKHRYNFAHSASVNATYQVLMCAEPDQFKMSTMYSVYININCAGGM